MTRKPKPDKPGAKPFILYRRKHGNEHTQTTKGKQASSLGNRKAVPITLPALSILKD